MNIGDRFTFDTEKEVQVVTEADSRGFIKFRPEAGGVECTMCDDDMKVNILVDDRPPQPGFTAAELELIAKLCKRHHSITEKIARCIPSRIAYVVHGLEFTATKPIHQEQLLSLLQTYEAAEMGIVIDTVIIESLQGRLP